MTTRRELLAGALSTAAATATGGRLASTGSPAAAAGPFGGYVMGYFTESPNRLANNYGLHLAVSTDGTATTSSVSRSTTQRRCSPRTRRSCAPRAWPTPPGHPSGRTTSRTATCAPPTSSCASTSSARGSSASARADATFRVGH